LLKNEEFRILYNMLSKLSLGHYGEQIAKQYLAERGYAIIDQNYYTRYGEIDLIVAKNGTIIFVEVKTRTNTAYGYPEDSISKKKKKSLVACAQRYMINKTQPWQIDVIAITLEGNKAKVLHIENCV